VITLEQAVDAGCDHFLRHGTLDMEAVAPALAVSRATLYRVVSSRDRLLGEVLWRLAERALDHARARRKQDGIEGVLEVVRCFARQVLATRALRTFIAREPQTATRVLATPDGGVHRRAIEAVMCLFEEVGLPRRSPYDLATAGLVEDPERVAYLLVRIVESLCFAEVAGTKPDLDLTEQTVRGLLVRACTPRQSRVSRFLDAAMCLVWTSVPEVLLAESRVTTVVAGI
jgi:hypothetical protein